jgi:putative transposase
LKTISELAREHAIHPNLVRQWKSERMEQGSGVFGGAQDEQRQTRAHAARAMELYAQIGRLKMDLAWVKKKLPASADDTRGLIEPGHAARSLRRPCERLGLNRATWYDEPRGESAWHVRVMRLIDAKFLRAPIDGVPRMTEYRAQTTQRAVTDTRVRCVMRLMGWHAIDPQPRTTLGSRAKAVFPYLWRGVESVRPTHVWSTDITDVPMRHGCMDLVAIVDWDRRDVLAWELSHTLDGECCLTTLEHALQLGKPEICNTDQGAQFTAQACTGRLQAEGIRVRRDGRGRACDTIFVERRWRTVTYEDLSSNDDASVAELRVGLTRSWHFDNHARLHQSLGYHPPVSVHCA